MNIGKPSKPSGGVASSGGGASSNTDATDEPDSSNVITPPSVIVPEGPSNPAPPKSQEKTLFDLIESYKSENNDNVNGYLMKGQPRAIIWTKGITAPIMHEDGGHFTKTEADGYLEYKLDYRQDNGWYDVNKTADLHQAFCSAAVSANMLHWWYDQNSAFIHEYLQRSTGNGRIGKDGFFQYAGDFINSFKSQENSHFFQMFLVHFSSAFSNGIWSDNTIDSFINGFTPKTGGGVNTDRDATDYSKGGFFKDVFKNQKLTDRTHVRNYRALSYRVKEWLSEGRTIALSYHRKKGHPHIIQIWGAEYDEKGKLTAIYISDSDDQDEKTLGMKRWRVVDADVARITSSISSDHGPSTEDLYSLSLGTSQWEAYFNTQAQNGEQSSDGAQSSEGTQNSEGTQDSERTQNSEGTQDSEGVQNTQDTETQP